MLPRAASIVVVIVVVGGLAQAPARAQSEPAMPEFLPVEGQGPTDPANPNELASMVVLAAAKTQRTVDEAPAIAEIITRAQIDEWGYQSVADLLRHLVGFYLIDDYIQPNVAVRGISGGLFAESGIIKVMIDGRSVAFRSTSGNWLGPELLPLSLVDRIEVIRGPASSLYGADAFLGVINIITQSPDSVRGEMRLGTGLSLANPGRPGGDIDLGGGGRYKRFYGVVGVRVNTEDWSNLQLPESSPSPTIPSYNAAKRTTSGLDQYSLVGVGRVGYDFDKLTLELNARYAMLDRSGELSPWTQLSNGTDANHLHNETRVSLYQGSLALTLKTRPRTDFNLTFDTVLSLGEPLAQRDRIEVNSDIFYVRRRFGYKAIDSNLEAQWKLPRNFNLLLGADGVVDDEQLPSSLHILKFGSGDLKAGDVLESSSVRQGTKPFFNLGAYAQVNWAPLKRLSLTGGFRYDYQNIYGSQPSGRLAVVARLAQGMYLKILYGSAFKAPSPLLLYAVPLLAGDVLGNPNLKPEYVHTFETELSYRPNHFVSLRTDVAYNLLLNDAEFTLSNGNQVARNVGEVRSLSSESELAAYVPNWTKAYVRLEYNWTQRDLGYIGYRALLIGNDNVIYPSLIVRGGLQGQVPKVPLRATAELLLVGARRASEGNILANGASYSLPPYLTLDLGLSTVGVHLFPKRELQIMVIARNVTGSRGPDPGFAGIDYPLPPRVIWLQLRQEL